MHFVCGTWVNLKLTKHVNGIKMQKISRKKSVAPHWKPTSFLFLTVILIIGEPQLLIWKGDICMEHHLRQTLDYKLSVRAFKFICLLYSVVSPNCVPGFSTKLFSCTRELINYCNCQNLDREIICSLAILHWQIRIVFLALLLFYCFSANSLIMDEERNGDSRKNRGQSRHKVPNLARNGSNRSGTPAEMKMFDNCLRRLGSSWLGYCIILYIV